MSGKAGRPSKLEAQRKKVLEELREIQSTVVAELKGRVVDPAKRALLGVDELGSIIKTCRESLDRASGGREIGDVEAGSRIQVVTRMPLEEEGEKVE